jgi:hypothetical protein
MYRIERMAAGQRQNGYQVKISQREAYRLKKRVEQLERARDLQRSAWAAEWVGGVHLKRLTVDAAPYTAVLTARKLGHAVVVTCQNDNTLDLFALPLKGQP